MLSVVSACVELASKSLQILPKLAADATNEAFLWETRTLLSEFAESALKVLQLLQSSAWVTSENGEQGRILGMLYHLSTVRDNEPQDPVSICTARNRNRF